MCLTSSVCISEATAGRCENSTYDQLITLKFSTKNKYMNITMVPQDDANPFHMLSGSGPERSVKSDEHFDLRFAGKFPLILSSKK